MKILSTTTFFLIFLTIPVFKSFSQYQIEEWEKKAGTKDSVLVCISTYDKENRIIEKTKLDQKPEKLIIQYDYKGKLLFKERWSTPTKMDYLIYTYSYNEKDQLLSISKNYNKENLSVYKSFHYNSKGQLIRKILYADDSLTDAEETFIYKRNLLQKKEVRLGTVYGKDRDKSVWIEDKYIYYPDNKIRSVEVTYFDDEGKTKFITSYNYNKEGIESGREEYKVENNSKVLESTSYFVKVPVKINYETNFIKDTLYLGEMYDSILRKKSAGYLNLYDYSGNILPTPSQTQSFCFEKNKEQTFKVGLYGLKHYTIKNITANGCLVTFNAKDSTVTFKNPERDHVILTIHYELNQKMYVVKAGVWKDDEKRFYEETVEPLEDWKVGEFVTEQRFCVK